VLCHVANTSSEGVSWAQYMDKSRNYETDNRVVYFLIVSSVIILLIIGPVLSMDVVHISAIAVIRHLVIPYVTTVQGTPYMLFN
jgi:hypothetical protein